MWGIIRLSSDMCKNWDCIKAGSSLGHYDVSDDLATYFPASCHFNPVKSGSSVFHCMCMCLYMCMCLHMHLTISWDPACVNCLSVLSRVMSCNAPLELTVWVFPFSLPRSKSQREVCPRRLLERSPRIVSLWLTLLEDDFTDRIELASAVRDRDRV